MNLSPTPHTIWLFCQNYFYGSHWWFGDSCTQLHTEQNIISPTVSTTASVATEFGFRYPLYCLILISWFTWWLLYFINDRNLYPFMHEGPLGCTDWKIPNRHSVISDLGLYYYNWRLEIKVCFYTEKRLDMHSCSTLNEYDIHWNQTPLSVLVESAWKYLCLREEVALFLTHPHILLRPLSHPVHSKSSPCRQSQEDFPHSPHVWMLTAVYLQPPHF